MSHTQKIQNDHADEQIEVSGSSISSKSEEHDEFQTQHKAAPREPNPPNFSRQKQAHLQSGYDPLEYINLPVSNEVKELFKSIQRYTPIIIELETKFKAFIPDLVPAIGEVDAFLKMPRPDGQPETLGLAVLDEPALNQSNKAKIELLITHSRKQYNDRKNAKVHTIEAAEKNPKAILSWISSVGDIHKNKQPPSVNYSKPMPDIDSLMQQWPSDVEDMLGEVAFPGEEIDLPLSDYCRLACSLLDIPVYNTAPNSMIESLHVLLTLYCAFSENQHFPNNHSTDYFEANQ